MADWTTLDELPAGSLFETVDGVVAFKTRYNRCYFVGSGERFSVCTYASEIEVRRLEVHPAEPTDLPAPSLLNRPLMLTLMDGGYRFGVIFATDERGVWFRGKMERENPNERERTWFVPWGSIAVLEMEGE